MTFLGGDVIDGPLLDHRFARHDVSLVISDGRNPVRLHRIPTKPGT